MCYGAEPGRQQRPGFSLPSEASAKEGLSGRNNEKEGDMWFIIIVLLISFLLNLNNREKENEITEYKGQERIVHPAEYLMR